MIKFHTLFVLVAFLLTFSTVLIKAGGGGGEDPSGSLDGVVDLTPDNFNDFIGKADSKAALVEFYAPWCGHCKSLVGEYAKLGKAAKGSSKVLIAKVNADAHGELGSKFGVSGFPTIKFFPAGGSTTPEDYNGGRDAKSFIKFLNEKANAGLFLPYEHTPTIVINGLAQHDKVVGDKTKKLVFVKYYAPWCGHCKSVAPTWNKLAEIYNKNEKATVAIVDCDADQAINKAVATKVGVQGFPTIKYYIEGGEAQDYNGGRSLEDFVAFVNEKTGLSRNVDGGLTSTAGTTPELVELAGKFLETADRTQLIAQIAAAVGSDANLDWFNKIAASIVAKGNGYVDTEFARVSKILEGSAAGTKKDSLSLKKNALAAFKKA